MTMFVENPVFIIIIGVIFCSIPVLMWSNTGESFWLKLLIAGVVLFGSWLAFERNYETDRESLYRTVYMYRDLVRGNKIQELLQHVDPQLKSRIDVELGRYEFTNCNVTNLSNKPEFSTRNGEVLAEIQFLATATIQQLGSAGPIKVRLKLRKVGPGKWSVIEAAAGRLGPNQPFVDSFDRL